MYSITVRQAYTLQSVPTDISSTHLAPAIVRGCKYSTGNVVNNVVRTVLNNSDSGHCQFVFTFDDHISIKMPNATLRLVLFIMLKRLNNKFFKYYETDVGIY